jgi:hypothetical protein
MSGSVYEEENSLDMNLYSYICIASFLVKESCKNKKNKKKKT